MTEHRKPSYRQFYVTIVTNIARDSCWSPREGVRVEWGEVEGVTVDNYREQKLPGQAMSHESAV